jgi:DNA-binding transcriptional LysR family regulator
MASISIIDFPALLARLRRRHPGISVQLRTSPYGSGGLTAELTRGDLDAALVANDGSPIPGMRLTRLLTTPIVVLLREDHPLAGQNAVDLADLAGEQFIDFPIGFGHRRIVDAAFTRLGRERAVAIEVTDVTDAAAYVRHGLGVSLVPRWPGMVGGTDVRTVLVQRPDLPLVLSIGVSTVRTTTAAAQALLDLIPAYVTSETVPAAPPGGRLR